MIDDLCWSQTFRYKAISKVRWSSQELALVEDPRFSMHYEVRRWILAVVFSGQSSGKDDENILVSLGVVCCNFHFLPVFSIRLGMYYARFCKNNNISGPFLC